MKKNLTKVVMVLAAITMLAACSPKVSGTFSGTSTGMQGPVTVELTVADGKITAVNVTECHETPSLCEVALARIPAQIVEHQTTYVDTVTGATLCSNALINAAGKAAKEAGLDVEKMKKNAYHAKAGKDETFDTDVLVIGGGGAGLSAAIAAGQQGAKVILIEKGSVLGGNTMMAGGAFNCVDPEAQAGAKLSNAQKNTLDSYLKLSTSDKDLHFELFPEWAKVLTGLQDEITAFYAANKGKTLPGFDTINLHMWHIYTGGLRQMDNGSWVAPQYDLAYTLASHALESYDWTGSLGVATKSHAAASDSLYTVLGAMWPRTHAYTNGKPLIDKLREAAEKEGVVIYTEMAGKDLIMAGGKVAGAHAVRADGTKVTINAKKGVVLASGGYCANPAMVKEYDEYWGADLTNRTLTTNVGTNTGDGIVMAQAVGAATRDLGVSQLMPSSSPIKGTMTDGVWADASEQIWIDAKGNRFVNEYAERDVLAKASLKLDNGIFYILFAGSGMANPDKMCKGAAKEGGMFGTSITDMINNGHIWYGSTLKELAEASKKSAGGAAPAFTEEALRATIEKYNSYVDAQYDPDFGKEVLNGKIDIAAIEADPNVGFIISPRKSSLHHTMGGVSINTEAEVIDANGNAIPGLWAAGEVTGGVHAGNRLGGNAIADIFTFGLIAGRNAGK